jgi:FkbH-like protein
MACPELSWLPEAENARERIAALAAGGAEFAQLQALAATRCDFLRAHALDQIWRRRWPEPPPGFAGPRVRLAALGSSTLGHLIASLRLAALRGGVWLDVHQGDYGQYRQAVEEKSSAFHAFRPDAALFCFDADHLCSLGDLAALRAHLAALWRAAGCRVLQCTALPSPPPLLGANEHRLPESRAAFVAKANAALRDWADAEGVDLVALDAAAARDGLAAWRDPVLWARAKQDVKPAAAPMFGELAARVLLARMGRSRKCLVLDLDNTLWGGVVGDDGLEGVALGQGSALGEGFLAVQAYARALSERGIILAVCSKNDEANALAPFEKHPDMILRRKDIACFVANWDDKADNIRLIAERLNIGLDALVFLDDNPFERNCVREALPMVAVPEIPEDPALVPDALAAAGYFEGVALTVEDRARQQQYAGNAAHDDERARHSGLSAYLASLQMRAAWGYFDALNKPRIVQLVNKTNQFNLTTRRHSEADYDAILRDPEAVGLHLRLSDRFGDNGLIAVVLLRREGADMRIDLWLMSCRVLGRGVEQATLALIVEEARRRGAERLIGEYVESPKNAMVREHYAKLGFSRREDGRYALRLADYVGAPTCIALERQEGAGRC